MKHTHILKRPLGGDSEVIDPDNPPWAEEMLGPPIFRYGNSSRTPGKIVTKLKLDARTLEFLRTMGMRPAHTDDSSRQMRRRKVPSHPKRRR